MSTHPFTITDQLIDDTLCTALEGGITYWAQSAEPTTWPEGCKYASDALTRGADLTIVDGSDDDRPSYTLTRAGMVKGIREYCKQFKTTPAGMDDDPVDAGAADWIVQVALFGEAVYA
jgi:hypothetical protein